MVCVVSYGVGAVVICFFCCFFLHNLQQHVTIFFHGLCAVIWGRGCYRMFFLLFFFFLHNQQHATIFMLYLCGFVLAFM